MRRDAHAMLDLATAVDALIGRLAPGAPSLTAASRHELARLHGLLDAEGTSEDALAQAREHLGRLDDLLSLAVAAGAENAYMLADRLALVEEFELDDASGWFASASAAALGDGLAALRGR